MLLSFITEIYSSSVTIEGALPGSFESGSSGNQFSKWNFSTPSRALIARPFCSGILGIERNRKHDQVPLGFSLAPAVHSRKRVQTDGDQMGEDGSVILIVAF